MKFRFVWVGKTKNENWKALQEDYLKRLSHFVAVEITEVRDAAHGSNARIEGDRILEILNPKSLKVLLDIGGNPVSSPELAARIDTWLNRGLKEVSFIIGGANGVSAPVAEMADDRLSLSFLTFTHEMTRVVLLEQLYRAYSILKGFPYQK